MYKLCVKSMCTNVVFCYFPINHIRKFCFFSPVRSTWKGLIAFVYPFVTFVFRRWATFVDMFRWYGWEWGLVSHILEQAEHCNESFWPPTEDMNLRVRKRRKGQILEIALVVRWFGVPEQHKTHLLPKQIVRWRLKYGDRRVHGVIKKVNDCFIR